MTLFSSLAQVHAQSVTVFAASSLKPALDDIAQSYDKADNHSSDPKIQLNISYAGSALLARQIQQGAPADIFISANAQWMDAVAQKQGVQKPQVLASNRLVVVSHAAQADMAPVLTPHILAADDPVFDELAQARIAMGFVEAVPVGQYGKAALEAVGQWERLSPNVVQTDNARAALNLVALGQLPFGIVYATDAQGGVQADPRVVVRGAFAAQSHPPITYPALNLKPKDAGASAFFDYLLGADAQAIFNAHGFLPAPDQLQKGAAHE